MLWALLGLPANAHLPYFLRPSAEEDRSESSDSEDFEIILDGSKEARKMEIAEAKREIRKLNIRARQLLCQLYDQEQFNLSKVKSPETIIDDADKFRIYLKIGLFKPEEISVKEVDRTLVVTGKHVEKAEAHGTVEREFLRKYNLPKDVKWDEIAVRLTKNGVLSIEAPKHPKGPSSSSERLIPIMEPSSS